MASTFPSCLRPRTTCLHPPLFACISPAPSLSPPPPPPPPPLHPHSPIPPPHPALLCAFSLRQLLATPQRFVSRQRFHCLSLQLMQRSYVLEFFLQTLVKKGHTQQREMFRMQKVNGAPAYRHGITRLQYAHNVRMAGAYGCGVRCSCRGAAVCLSLDCFLQHVYEFCVEETRFRVRDGAYGCVCSVVATGRNMGERVG
jgi:hypothetical protein